MREVFLWLHAASTVTWFGGLFFYLVVASPAVRKVSDREGMHVLNEMDRRFRHVLWGSVEVAVGTGIALVVMVMIEKGTMMKVSAAYTQILMGKIFLAAIMVALQLYDQIRINPRKISIGTAPGAADVASYAALQARTLQLYALELIPAAGLLWLGLQMQAVL